MTTEVWKEETMNTLNNDITSLGTVKRDKNDITSVNISKGENTDINFGYAPNKTQQDKIDQLREQVNASNLALFGQTLVNQIQY